MQERMGLTEWERERNISLQVKPVSLNITSLDIYILPIVDKHLSYKKGRVTNKPLFFPIFLPFCTHLEECLVINYLSLVHFFYRASLG